jgi:DNA-binding transcriptional regulator PaaX
MSKIKKYGSLTAKVLGILGNGFILSLSKDKRERLELHRECDRLWHEIDRKELYHVLRRLRLQGFVETIKKTNELEKINFSEKGKNHWLRYQFRSIKLKKPKRWDKKWRMVLFDIPETHKKIRDSLRKKLKNLGFLEFQKSVFIYPFPCRDEINFIINFYNIEEKVYYLETEISPDYKFRKSFFLK